MFQCILNLLRLIWRISKFFYFVKAPLPSLNLRLDHALRARKASLFVPLVKHEKNQLPEVTQ